MIKAAGTWDDGRPLTIFGIDPENVRRLKAGQPIRVDMATMGRPEVGVVLIVFGESDEAIARSIGAEHLLDAAKGQPS